MSWFVEQIIADNLNIEKESIKDESNFVNDLGADSLNIVEVIMGIEKEYEIEIPDEDVESLHTVGDLKKYIEDNS
jgi:acyl carrier protein|tara:strand:- start:355 stop:579 length:225 start_codon:yes stop_codon:yes gene_type:complete